MDDCPLLIFTPFYSILLFLSIAYKTPMSIFVARRNGPPESAALFLETRATSRIQYHLFLYSHLYSALTKSESTIWLKSGYSPSDPCSRKIQKYIFQKNIMKSVHLIYCSLYYLRSLLTKVT